MLRLITIACTFFSCALFSFGLFAADKSPKLSGEITVSILNGTIDAKFQLANIPQIEDYLIFINSGLNIQYIKKPQSDTNFYFNRQYDSNSSYESFGYSIPDNTGEAKFLPKSLEFKYTGKFPVVSDINSANDVGDWKGNIAFNGKSIRTDGFQTAWYPILYDIKNDKRFHEYRYDIEVTCSDCESIYVNGSAPVASQKARFKRDEPVSITLFAGDYRFEKHHGNYYLNTGLSKPNMTKLADLTASFTKFYEEELGLSYGENVVYIHTTPTTKKNSWLFVAYPAIVAINQNKDGLNGMFDGEDAKWFQPFIAHELAHYYFGTLRDFNSALGDTFSESFSEYLALKATQSVIGQPAYQADLAKKLDRLKDVSFVPFDAVQNGEDFGSRQRYVYTYAPIIWLALEQEIGAQNMWSWLNKILTAETNQTDYAFMLKTLGNTLNDDAKLSYLAGKYFTNSDALKNAQSMLVGALNKR